ncbi:hypothetical protein [Hydrogenophaga sp.]|uniref:hypothetical protein n=1 Tax=Hydrogenophaga sp. TaxID=1904254 RepID=UPI002636EEBD|nr:hypothetical protein [Hydrogenophaga sp.]MCW5653500.1 hypothetical protein [Hydrogenophaga sp.]
MNTQTFQTPWSRTSAWARGLSIAALAAGAWALSTVGSQAHARSDVYWSIGVNSPGVAVGVSNAPPVYYAPPPVYVAPRPVYVAPRPVYYAPPPVYYAPPPVYYAPRPVVVAPRPVYGPGWGYGPRWDDRRGHRHRHGHR